MSICCKDCNAKDSGQRFPEQDIFSHRGKEPLKVCFKCRVCGILTWYPIDKVKWVDTGKLYIQRR